MECKNNKYSKTCVKRPLSKRPKIGFQDQLLLNAGQKYCRCSKASILQFFRPSLSYHLSLRSMFFLFLSGHFTQLLLYIYYHSILESLNCTIMVIFRYHMGLVTTKHVFGVSDKMGHIPVSCAQSLARKINFFL